jgi:hypothetical protein
MTLKEKRIKIIEDNIKNCVKGNSTPYYTYGNIPNRCIRGVRRVCSFLNNVDDDDIIGLIDTTIFGGAERGMVFTTEGVIFKDMFAPFQFVSKR